MASTLSAAQLADLVAKSKIFMKIEADDTALQADAIALYGDDAVLSTATVEVTDDNLILVDDVTGTTTTSLTAAATDTISEMVTAIDAVANWNATLLGISTASSSTLIRLAATNALGMANEVTLKTENEALLELLITNVLAGIETVLDRCLLSTTFSELYRINGDKTIVLTQPDVTQVTMVALETEDGLTVEYTGSDTHARVEVTNTSVVLTSRAGGTTTTNTILFADQATTTAMATAVSAVSGWTGTVKNDRPSGFLVRHGVRDAKDREVTLEVWDDTDQDYLVEYDEGLISLETSPFLSIGPARTLARVDYTAGFTTIPADVELAILGAIKSAFDQSTINVNLESERLGDYMYKNRADISTIAQDAGVTTASKMLFQYARIRP